MRKTKLRLTRISDAKLVQRVVAARAGLTKNAAQFTNAADLVAILDTAFEPFAAATQAVAEVKVELRARVAAKNGRRKRMESTFRYIATSVERQARGKPGLIYAAGMNATNVPRPVLMTPVQNLTLTPGNEGELLARWRPVRGKRIYDVQVCRGTVISPDRWATKARTTKARCRLNHDLVTGSKVWVRVRAIGTNGTGAWSQPVRKKVP
jgi:hypothetical protein